jgi:genome maintenance exonuclease 1
MFIHNASIEIPNFELKITHENGTRFYLTENGNKYPSITSVLSANPEKRKGLQQWRKRVGHEEATKISGRAARRGTAVHKMCEDYLNNEEDYSNGAMPDSLQMFNSLKPILDENLNNIHTQEAMLYSDYLGVAGRVDCIAEWNGVPAVIDFKTSSKPKRLEWVNDYFMQCSAYAAMYFERTDIAIKDIVVAVMVDNNKPQIFTEKVSKWLPTLKRAIDEFNIGY